MARVREAVEAEHDLWLTLRGGRYLIEREGAERLATLPQEIGEAWAAASPWGEAGAAFKE
jgi:hypothetical protein